MDWVSAPDETSLSSRVNPLLSVHETGDLLCTGSSSLSPKHGGFAADNDERVAWLRQRWLREDA